MTTTAIDARPAPAHRSSQVILVSCVVSGLMGVLLGIGATALVTQDSSAPAAVPATAEANIGLFPTSADAAEHRATRAVEARLPTTPDAAERWAAVEVGDFPGTPDAAERWLGTP